MSTRIAAALIVAPLATAAAQGTGTGTNLYTIPGSAGTTTNDRSLTNGAPNAGNLIPPDDRSTNTGGAGMVTSGTGGAGMGGSGSGGIAGASKGAVGGPGPVSGGTGDGPGGR